MAYSTVYCYLSARHNADLLHLALLTWRDVSAYRSANRKQLTAQSSSQHKKSNIRVTSNLHVGRFWVKKR